MTTFQQILQDFDFINALLESDFNKAKYSIDRLINIVNNVQVLINPEIQNETDSKENKKVEKSTKTTTCSLKKVNKIVNYPFEVIKKRISFKNNNQQFEKLKSIVSRVHDRDCLHKKIKAKYLKFLLGQIHSDKLAQQFSLGKFDQKKFVKNVDPSFNQKNFINENILDLLVKNNILNENDLVLLYSSKIERVIEILNMTVKNHFHEEFLTSTYFKEWVMDPLKLYQKNIIKISIGSNYVNRLSVKFKKYSRNLFENDSSTYEYYKKLLLITSCNFILQLQNL